MLKASSSGLSGRDAREPGTPVLHAGTEAEGSAGLASRLLSLSPSGDVETEQSGLVYPSSLVHAPRHEGPQHSCRRWVIISGIMLVVLVAVMACIFVYGKGNVKPVDWDDNNDVDDDTPVPHSRTVALAAAAAAALRLRAPPGPGPNPVIDGGGGSGSNSSEPIKPPVPWDDIVDGISTRPWFSGLVIAGVGLFAGAVIFAVVRFEIPRSNNVRMRKESDTILEGAAATSAVGSAMTGRVRLSSGESSYSIPLLNDT